MSFFKALGGCIDKTFIYLWGLLGLKFVRDRQMPTEQREVGIWRSLYLSLSKAECFSRARGEREYSNRARVPSGSPEVVRTGRDVVVLCARRYNSRSRVGH